jgi:hypothetical protein
MGSTLPRARNPKTSSSYCAVLRDVELRVWRGSTKMKKCFKKRGPLTPWRPRDPCHADRTTQTFQPAATVPSFVPMGRMTRTGGTCTYIRPIEHQLPRNNGKDQLLLCPSCHIPRRELYGVRIGDDGRYCVLRRADWICRRCAGLRYSSEGGHLCPGRVLRALGNLPRPSLWLQCVWTSPNEAADKGMCNLL